MKACRAVIVCMWLAACATPQSAQRNLASTPVVSPFTQGGESPREVVNKVIARLGPVRNQLDTQICFGHAVADVVTFHTGVRVSAFSVAVRNFQHRKGLDYVLFNSVGGSSQQVNVASRYQMGLASSTLESSLKGSLCRDDQPENGLTYLDEHLKILWDTYHKKFRSYIGPTAPTALYTEIESGLRRVVPSLPADDFIRKISRYKPFDHALGEWFDKWCDVEMPRDKKWKVVGSEIGLRGGGEVVRQLNAALESGEPAVVHYDARVLDAQNPSFWESVIGFHVSAIVARAEINGVDHYLLRNSWGNKCDEYARDIQARCDRGHIWITEAEVAKYVTSVAYFSWR